MSLLSTRLDCLLGLQEFEEQLLEEEQKRKQQQQQRQPPMKGQQGPQSQQQQQEVRVGAGCCEWDAVQRFGACLACTLLSCN